MNAINPSTKYLYSSQCSSNDLKVGDRVVIHAKPNAQKELVGVEVKWSALSAVQK